MGPGKDRGEIVKLRLTPGERARLFAYAKANGATVSQLIRMRLLDIIA